MSEKDYQDDIYSKIEVNKDTAFGLNKEFRLNIIKYVENKLGFNFNNNLNIAEIGCGTGYLSAFLLREYKNINADLYDLSTSIESSIKEVMEISKISTKRYKFFSGDASEKMESEKYDFVFSCGALHHSHSLKKYLKSIQKSLKPGGFLICQEPCYSEENDFDSLRKIYLKRLEIDLNSVKPIYGRYDFFFRPSEYFVTSRYAGLELYHLKKWKLFMNHPKFYVGRNFENKPFLAFLKYVLKIFLNFYRNSKYFIRSRREILPKNYIFVFKKPAKSSANQWLPHLDLLGLKEE